MTSDYVNNSFRPWKPIEKAPKDSTVLIAVLRGGEIATIHWFHGWWKASRSPLAEKEIVAWMSVPKISDKFPWEKK
jgi:hypothetical protein